MPKAASAAQDSAFLESPSKNEGWASVDTQPTPSSHGPEARSAQGLEDPAGPGLLLPS